MYTRALPRLEPLAVIQVSSRPVNRYVARAEDEVARRTLPP